MIVLETDRLELRQLTPDDAGFILDLLNQPSFLRFIGDRGVRTLDDAREYIASGPEDSHRRNGFGLYLVSVTSVGAPAGICGVMKKEWLEDPDLAYAFLPRFWSKGYALEAASAVLAHGWRTWGLHRVLAVVRPDNSASIRLLEKLAFSFERTVADPVTGEDLRLLAAAATPTQQDPCAGGAACVDS